MKTKLVKENLNEAHNNWYYKPSSMCAMIGNRTSKDPQRELQDAYDKSIKSSNESLNEGFATRESENLDRIADMLGYDDFAEFLGDNRRCYDVIIEWIDQTFAEKIADEGLDDPERLEKLRLYHAAELTRETMGEDEDVDTTPSTRNSRNSKFTRNSRNSKI